MKGYWLSVYEKVADPEIQKKYAEKCYNSKEYKEALYVLKDSAKRSLQIVEGA